MSKKDRGLFGWCAYCKDPIYRDEPCDVEGSKIFHPGCLRQKNTFRESFEDYEKNSDEDESVYESEVDDSEDTDKEN